MVLLSLFVASSVCAGQLEDGRAAYERGEYEKALALFHPLAEQGNSIAQYVLGNLYYFGLGVRKDEEQAVKWYRKASEAGIPEAQYNLGVTYRDGLGVRKDEGEAVRWWRKAADQGNADAQWGLGVMYRDGRGVLKSISAAVDWFYKAGMSYLKEGQRGDALTALDRINTSSPGHWLGAKLQQAIYAGNGDTSEEPSNASEETELKESISQGTGWFVAPGIVVSNFHVLDGKSTFIVLLPGGKKFPASLMVRDQANDIASLRLTPQPQYCLEPFRLPVPPRR